MSEAKKPFILTENNFFELFILCLFWKWKGPEAMTSSWTTVDHVKKILVELGVLNPAVAKKISAWADYQSVFLRRITRQHNVGADNILIKCESHLVLRQDARTPINRNRVLQDTRLYLTVYGASEAAKLESKYADVITREDFIRVATQIRERMDELPNSVKVRLAQNYTRRVNPEPED